VGGTRLPDPYKNNPWEVLGYPTRIGEVLQQALKAKKLRYPTPQ